MKDNLTNNDKKLLKRLNRLSFKAKKHMLKSVWKIRKISKYDEDNYFPIGMADLQNGKLSNQALNKFRKLGFIQTRIGSPVLDTQSGLYNYFAENILIIPTADSRDYLTKIREERLSFIKQSILVPIIVTIATTVIIWCLIWLSGLLNIQLPNQQGMNK